MAFAAFIVVVAVVLFGFAMAMGTIARQPSAEVPSTENVPAEQASSENTPPTAALPAVTEPEANARGDDSDGAADEADAQPEAQAPAQPKAEAASETPAPATTPTADTTQAMDPSFPARHAETQARK